MSARCEVRAGRPASWGVGGMLSGERKKGLILFLTPLQRSLGGGLEVQQWLKFLLTLEVPTSFESPGGVNS